MSPSGQTRKSEPVGWMSALPLKAEIADDRRHVREVPRGDMPTVQKEAIVGVCHFANPAFGARRTV